MTPKETTETKPDPSTPDYDRIAAEMMQQWQQQFVKPELAEAIGKSGTVAQTMLEMGQVLWQNWLSGQPTADAATPDGMTDKPAAPAAESAYAGGDAAPVYNSDAPTAAAPVYGAGAASGTSNISDTTAAASMASVALCAELARRLDLLSQRVWQLEQQLANK